MNSAERRFAELLSLALDGACSDAEREEFARLERENPQLAVGFVDTIFTHCLLQWQSEDISECMTLELAANARDEAVERSASQAVRNSRRHFWAAGAAVLLVAAGIAAWQLVGFSMASEPIADLVAQNGVAWANNSTALRSGNLIVPGRLQNNSGSFTLQFRSGPTVRIAGPTSLDIKSAMLVFLDRGQATARVPQSSKGFAIKTPVAKVVDQGTEFGVAARDDGKTDVIVFEGRVDVQEMAGALTATAKFDHWRRGANRRPGFDRSNHGNWTRHVRPMVDKRSRSRPTFDRQRERQHRVGRQRHVHLLPNDLRGAAG